MNAYFQAAGSNHEAGKNENGVTYTSVLVNLATSMNDDGRLVINATAGGGSQSYQWVGFDAHGPDRDLRRFHSFNFFARNAPTSSTSFTDSNRRWLAVVDGSTKKILYNKVLPNSFGPLPTVEVTEIRAAVNMAELPVLTEDFTAWASARITNGNLRGENDDADGDGMVNLLEYAYGTNPMLGDSEKGPRIVIEDGAQVLYYQRSMIAEVSPIAILGGEFPDSTTEIDVSGSEETGEVVDDIEQVKVVLTPGLGGKLFVRLSTARR